MLLSPRKKFGHTHVKAARILRVAKDHSVATLGAPSDAQMERFEGRSWVFCEVGDLVIEIVKAKKHKWLGYSYLTGPAIQLMNYKPLSVDHFDAEPLKVGRVTFPTPRESKKDPDGFIETVKTLIASAMQANDICLFETTAQNKEAAMKAFDFLASVWEPAGGSAHLIGNVKFGKDAGIQIHFQPKKHATESCATLFQTSLLFNMVKK